MSIRKLREELVQARAAAAAGDTATAVRRLDEALQELEPEHLLTTTEAAHLLNVRSVNTVKIWCRMGYLHGIQRGGRTLIPVSEIERVHDSDQVRAIRALDTVYEATKDLGDDAGMTEEQMELLHASRPGKLPWER